ncbi:MAG TPA: methionyl-tRNA formyltransferase [Verrucomicrobiae bacterium]|jgi:methionyl-tRNA formyltransferase|nr:methionyl-tRNA formyltransferase [Verrucomicrobiae bacterium]
MLRIIFMGTAELACASLEALVRQPDFRVLAVVTQPDRPKGRDLKLQPSAVKQTALKAQLPVLQPERARHEDFIRQLRELAPDLIVVAAYGQILPSAILELPRHGCVNVHTSLLPKYRGAAPIQWAILNGEPETGVTIMKMDVGMDTGDILTQQTTPIAPTDNSQTLHDRLAQIGAELLIPTIRDYIAGKIIPRPQPTEGASHARKITREDGRLDWTQPAATLLNRIRAFTPWPGAFTHLPKPPTLLKIWRAEVADATGEPGNILSADKSGVVVACGRESLRITELQREGSRRMSVQDFLAGNPLERGEKFP